MKHTQESYIQELIAELKESGERSIVQIKEAKGGYTIKSVSTAAIEDREGETFTVEAIDYDIAVAKETGVYPEYRVFHSPLLGIGKVEKMSRVGIFAVEEGTSYTDPFSLAVCKELSNHDGKWRTSRGFRPIEVECSCPSCGKPLGITQKHMVVGFKCPVCTKGHVTYKGMKNVRYMKASTFDITATDVPAVPMTGMAAFDSVIDIQKEVNAMNKEQLRKRLLAAGVAADAIEARLGTITDEQLKEFDDVPFAHVLKEFGGEEVEQEEQVFTLDEGVLDALTERVQEVVKELLESAEIEIEDVEFKESDIITEMKEQIGRIEGMLEMLLQSDDDRLKELNTPAAKSRLKIYKSSGKKFPPKKMDEDEEDEDEEDEVETANGTKVSKETARWLHNFASKPVNKELVIDGAGNSYDTMTDFLKGGV